MQHIPKFLPKKYKVEFIQTETFVVDVIANNEKEAIEIANTGWENGDYQETGNLNITTGTVYDVTNTDDLFYPINSALCYCTDTDLSVPHYSSDHK